MALRTNPTLVQEILDTELNVLPFIRTASLVIDQYLATEGLSAALLAELECWLAAHFACIRDPRFIQGSTDGQSMTFERGKTGEGLKGTSYGQNVLLLDPTGILAQVTSTKRARINVD